jgi:curved DNA-binding protein
VQSQGQTVKLALTLEEAAQGGPRDLTVTDVVGHVKTYSVNLPAGIRPGQKIRLPGRGRAGGHGAPGDLYLEVQVKTHDRFRLDGRDLYTDIRVSPWEAALGTHVTVKTLNGSVKLRIPPGSSTGRKIRLRGKGFPARDGEGDLYAEIRVMVPETLTPRERELFEELARESSFKA